MFKVIEFEDNGLGIVREEWMTPRKKECLWPPYKVASKFNKCLMSQLPADEKWPVYAVKRVMFETDDLMLAREKCKKAESDSELVSEEEHSKKRKKRKANAIATDSESEEAEDYFNFKYPSPPQSSPKPIARKETSLKAARSRTPDTITKFTKLGVLNSDMNNTTQNTAETNFLLRDFNVDSPLPSPDPTSPTETSIDKINTSLELIAKYIADVKGEIKEIKATQNDILLRLASTAPSKTSLPNEIDLPLKSTEDLNNIENWLENEENKQNLINNLSFVGGNTTASITRRILQRVFSTSLALQCNWTGKNNKFSLKNTRLTEVIINAVRNNKLAGTATEIEITTALTSWFRFARDRDGGRENRRAKTGQ